MTSSGLGFSIRDLTAFFLIASMVIFMPGGILFTGRAIWKWRTGQSPVYLRWERGFVIAALLAGALGLVLLDELLAAAGSATLARLALVTYLMGAAVLLVAELAYLHNGDWVYPQVVFYVVLACLAQAAFGVALLQSGLVPAWVGWATLLWNVAWLALMAAVSRRNMYFPAAHHLAPLLIGIALLMTG